MTIPIKIQSAPGIKRDGTVFEGESYIDGQWCRFQRGRPRKIGGYRVVTSTLGEIVRGMTSHSAAQTHYLHLGGSTQLSQQRINNDGSLIGVSDRTPVGFVSSTDNLWQFEHFYDSVGLATYVVAHAAPNLSDISSQTETKIWILDATTTGVLVDSTQPSASGGIVALGPYLFSFGHFGRILWSEPNNLTASTIGNQAFITQQKIVKGLPLRGASGGPAGLFWSLDSLIRASFVGGTTIWDFDTLSAESSILSSQGVIEYDGVYYWAGVDRFLMFNGVVRDLPNTFNFNEFYDNLNFTHRQKVFAFKVPHFGEIWWCYPKGTATECTHAVVYNVREGYWYDTQLPGAGRSSGLFAKVYNKPFMTGVDVVPATLSYELWQHETGTDRVDGTNVQPVASHFETAEISMLTQQPEPSDRSLHVARIEPDFVQVGDMTLTVRGRSNPKAPVAVGNPVTFKDVAAQGDEETIKLKDVRRLMSFRFESNTTGGHYEMGESIAHIEPADGRIES